MTVTTQPANSIQAMVMSEDVLETLAPSISVWMRMRQHWLARALRGMIVSKICVQKAQAMHTLKGVSSTPRLLNMLLSGFSVSRPPIDITIPVYRSGWSRWGAGWITSAQAVVVENVKRRRRALWRNQRRRVLPSSHLVPYVEEHHATIIPARGVKTRLPS